MKKIIGIGLIFFFSCTQSSKEVQLETVDSILMRSQSNLGTAAIVNHKSDSITKENVVKVIREIKYLANEVEKFKTERVQLMSLQQVNTEKIIYKIDTVFIEVEKNFWGKKKTTTSIKSDSSSVITEDSTIKTSEKIDTTSSNFNY